MSTTVRRADHRLGPVLALSAVLLTAAAVPSEAFAVVEPDQDAAEQAAREIAAARERANDAAEQFFAAESRLDLLELEQERLQDELADLALTVAELEEAVETVAVNRFVASGASGIPILTDL